MSIDEEDLERRLDFIVRELDECMILAASPETYSLIEREARALGQIKTRVDLLLSLIIGRQPSKWRNIIRG